MKIVSNFRDYYDCGMTFGVDKELVYVRLTPKEEDRINLGEWNNDWNLCRDMDADLEKAPFKKVKEMVFSRHYVSFCGKIYPYITVSVSLDEKYLEPFSISERYFNVYSYYDFKKSVQKFISEKEYNKWIEVCEEIDEYKYSWRASPMRSMRNFLSQSENLLTMQRAVEDIHYRERCPIIGISSNNKDKNLLLTLNPSLKEISFFKVEDAYTAFTEIEMFMGGVVTQKENEIVEIEDKFLAQGKGFDCYSFRKEPSKRKKKSCKCPK